MDSKERVLQAYSHKEPDRVPICIGGTAQKFSTETYYAVKKQLEITENLEAEQELDELGNVIHYHPRVLDYFGSDFRHIHINRLPPLRINSDGSWVHESGFTLQRNPDNGIVSIVTHPLEKATIADLHTFDWPAPDSEKRTEGVAEQIEILKTENRHAVGMYKATLLGIFDLCCVLRGMDTFLMDLAINEDFAKALIERVYHFTYGVYEGMLETAGEVVDVVEFNDDLGTQDNLIFSPDMYRKYIKPFHARLVEMFKKKAKNAKIFFHSCGAVYDIIPDFIEIGIDILNPIQPHANKMDTAVLKKEFGRDVCFQGGIDLQRAMIGTVSDVEGEVKKRIGDLGRGGGYILSTANNIGRDIPIKNVFKLYEYAKRFGKYPINGL
jgi:uroporphyrinogen decarboxylase